MMGLLHQKDYMYMATTLILVARLCSEIKYLTKRQMALEML